MGYRISADEVTSNQAYLAFRVGAAGVARELQGEARKAGTYQPVEFQFPPKVTGDSRRGNWDEKEVMGTEPFAFYKGSSSRMINLQITYICEGGYWNCKKIKQQITLIRGYFQRCAGSGVHQDNLVVRLRLWCIGGADFLTFRMKNCDVKYSETMVTAEDDNGSPVYFPLRTDISIELNSWTKNLQADIFKKPDSTGAPNAPAIPGQAPTESKAVQDVVGMSDRIPEDWY